MTATNPHNLRLALERLLAGEPLYPIGTAVRAMQDELAELRKAKNRSATAMTPQGCRRTRGEEHRRGQCAFGSTAD